MMKATPLLLLATALPWTAAATGAGAAERLRLCFGTGDPPPGFTRVAAGNRWDPGAGFGFHPGPQLREHARTAAGQLATREVTGNLRTPRIGEGPPVRLKQREKDAEAVTWDDRLTLEFSGARPCLRALEIAPAPATATVLVAGDSTACDQPAEPWGSWGQMLPRSLKPGVAAANHARSGETIRSSLAARRFEKIFSVMKPGDWLLVQCGHNDMKDRQPRALRGAARGTPTRPT